MRANRIQPPWRFGDSRVLRRGCPACGSTKVARMLMGLPGFSEDLERRIENGEVYLGGCVISMGDDGHPTDPERWCTACGTHWGRWVGPQSDWPRNL